MKKIKRILKVNSIQTSMIVSFMLLVSILVLFLSLSSYYYTMKDMENMSINYTTRLLKEINLSINSYILNLKNMAQVVVENKDVCSFMNFCVSHDKKELTKEEKAEYEDLYYKVLVHLNTVANTRNDITNIAVISRNKKTVLGNPTKKVNPYSEYNVSDWYLKPLSYKDNIIVSPSHVQNLIFDEYSWVISISKAIIDPETGTVTGVMVIDLNYKAIENTCENAQFGKNGYIYLIDNDKNIIFHPQQKLIYSGLKSELIDEIINLDDKNKYFNNKDTNKIYIKNYSPVTQWSAVGVVNINELIKNKPVTLNFYVFLAWIAIISSSILAVIISKAITKPIKMLENTMHAVEEGNFNVKSDINFNNEVGHLSKTFNVMISKIKLLMAQAVSIEEEKRKNEIKALQAQINPHFLYNTLDTIIWMSAGGKNDEVVEVTSALARLFRTSISEGDNLVPLEIEIENIRSYLTIQKMRYKDKLSYKIEIPNEFLCMKTLKLILQPIVENAVYHGIKLSPSGGEIKITASACDNKLILSVEDNGVGMSREQVSNLFKPDNHSHSGMGIGVNNVNNRIKLCFGEEYGLSYQSKKGRGTRVDILLPIIKDGVENE